MASIHRESRGKSKFWIAAFRGADGRRVQRSTKTEDRKLALKLANAFEEAAAKSRAGLLTATQARIILGELCGEPLQSPTVREWFASWIENRKADATPQLLKRYESGLNRFLGFLGAKADRPLEALTLKDCIGFRDSLANSGLVAAGVNFIVKIMGQPLNEAVRQGVLKTNPAAALKAMRASGESPRKPFTVEELRQLIEAGEGGDWSGLVILAATAGLRLGDASAVAWGDIDSTKNLLTVKTQKTGKVVVLPLHEDFLKWLSAQEQGIGKAPIFKDLHRNRVGGGGGLSAQFVRLMDGAGVGRGVVREGQNGGRTAFAKSFHSLRHFFVSAMANGGISSEVRQKLTGHSDLRVHEGYTHHEVETLRAAVGAVKL